MLLSKMKRMFLFIITGMLAITLFQGCSSPFFTSSQKNLVFYNGTILTMNQNNTTTEAVAVQNGLIEAAGKFEDIRPFINKNSKMINLEGKTLMPGFIDAHSHFPGSGLSVVGVDINSPPIGTKINIAQIIEALSKKAACTPRGKWIIGFGFDNSMILEKRFLTREDLDKVSTDHPIYIMHITGHFGFVNSFALKKLNITADTKNPEGGLIHKDPVKKEPTGILEETAKDQAQKAAFNFSFIEKFKMTRYAVKDYAKAGITTAQNGASSKSIISALSMLSKFGIIPLRMVVWPDGETGDKIVKGDLITKKYQTDKFQIGAVKLFADGSIQAYTISLQTIPDSVQGQSSLSRISNP